MSHTFFTIHQLIDIRCLQFLTFRNTAAMDVDEQDEDEQEGYDDESLGMYPRFVYLALPVDFQLFEALAQWFPK